MATKTAPNRLAPQNGNGKESSAPASVGREALGRTGLRQWSGRIDEEFLKELRYERKYQVYKEMSENDPIVGAVLRSLEYLIRGVDFRVEAEDPEDTAQADLAAQIQDRFDTMQRPWEEVLTELLSFLPYGWSFHEVLYEARPEGVYWADWPIRAQDTLLNWEFAKDATGKASDQLTGMTQQIQTDGTTRTIPMEKGLLFRIAARKNNPEGRSILRNSYLPWYYKNHLQRIEAIGVERDLAGYPVLYVPGEVLDNVSGTAYLAAQKIVTNIRRDEQEGCLLSSAKDAQGNPLWDLKLLSTGGTRAFDTNSIIDRYDQRIAMSCLADFVLLGHEKVGSFALHSSKTEVFIMSLDAVLDAICETVNRYAIPRLAELNGWPTDNLPTLVHGDIEVPDLKELGDYITALSGAGIPLFPDQKLENRLRELAGLPVLTPEEFDQREAVVAADKQAQLDAQVATAQATAQGAKDQAGQAQQQADKTAQQVKALLDRPVEKAQPQPIALTINGAPMTMTSPAPGAQTFNVTMPETKPSQVVMQQPITVAPSPAPPANVSLTVEAAKAAEVHTHTTIQAPPATVVPAPQVMTVVEAAKVEVTVEAPDPAVVNIAPTQVTVTNQIEKQDAPMIIVDTQPVADAIKDVGEKLKRPSKLTITNPDGTVTEATPDDSP